MLEDNLRELISMRWTHRRNREAVALIDRALVSLTRLLEARLAGRMTGLEAEAERLTSDLQREMKNLQRLH
jgi:hypothetical protein